MTTTPSRIGLIRPVVEAVLGQTVSIEHLELNIPYVCSRTGEDYSIPDWLGSMEQVRIFRTDDYGPITKVGPTLLRYRDDHETYIWSVDDDCAYPANQLELLNVAHRPDQRRILTRYGGKLQEDGAVQFWYGEAEVTMFEGFGGVLYPPACVGKDFEAYLNVTSVNEDCRKNDDIVLAMYFTSHGLPIYLYNKPSKDTPYMVTGWLPHAEHDDALVHTEHQENYRRIFAFISSLSSKKGKIGDTIRLKLWRGVDPFGSFPDGLIQVDTQGWNSQHQYLAEAIEELRPSVVVEIGVWKGGSTLFMASKLRELKLGGVVISVDTWLGSWDHWLNDRWFQELSFDHGYPKLFYKFAANVINHALQDFVVPFPADSRTAGNVLAHLNISADIIHIDAGHDYEAVQSDLAQWWKVLRPGGILICDDYFDDGSNTWPGVKAAVDEFVEKHSHSRFEAKAGKCRMIKN